MSTNFPSSLDNSTSLPYPTSTSDTNSPSLAGGQDNQNDALIAVETKVGINSSTPSSNTVLTGTGSGQSNWNLLTATNVTYATGSGAFVFASSPTISSPTINTPTINNPTLKTDSVIGYTSADSGTLYGISIASSQLSGSALTNSSVTGTQIASSTITPSNLNLNPQTANSNATNVTAYTNYGALANNVAVTVTVGPNGILLIGIGAQDISPSTSAFAYMSFALSGANTQAASNQYSINNSVAASIGFGRTFILTGLAAGSTTVTLMGNSSGGTTTSISAPNLWVLPL